jgi:hypothetical protein
MIAGLTDTTSSDRASTVQENWLFVLSHANSS